MISPSEVKGFLSEYKNISVATICSHSALQIFFGAKQEGFHTIGICKPGAKRAYDSFPLARPDEYLEVVNYSDVLDDDFQQTLREKNCIIVPHGSFVEYVGPKKIEEKFAVPMFGNRRVLEWEGDRQKEKRWLEKAGLLIPRELSPEEIEGPCIVKFHGAKGGRDFFIVNSKDEFEKKIRELDKRGKPFIQEYVTGVRYYPHYFYSPILERIELLGMDRRDESNIDGLSRLGLTRDEVERVGTYVVTGNSPLVVRESLLPQLIEMGDRTVKTSKELFPPGMVGPFCLETICRDDLKFVTFEISARIVAGTNLYPMGSPYSFYLFGEPMSTGRRISREIKLARERDELEKIIY